MNMEKIEEIYLELAYKQNPGDIGWGAIISGEEMYEEMSGYEAGTTHNRTYLVSAITILEALKGSCKGRFYTGLTFYMLRRRICLLLGHTPVSWCAGVRSFFQ